MARNKFANNMAFLTLAAVTLTAMPAQLVAGWGSWGGSFGAGYGSSGGSSWGCGGSHGGGSYGSSWAVHSSRSYGASWASYGGGSFGSRGTGLLSGLFTHKYVRRAANASYGGGSWGGSRGGWPSHGHGGSYGGSSGYASAGGWGSHGGATAVSDADDCCGSSEVHSGEVDAGETHSGVIDEGTIIDEHVAPEGTATEAPADPTSEARMPISGKALLSISVPADANVFVNDKLTRSTGQIRRYVSSGLKSAYRYAYQVRAVVQRDGKQIEETKTVRLTPGRKSQLSFDFKTAPETLLKVHVPSDAKVFLANHESTSTGEVRVFSTRKLANGQSWERYTVRVTVDRNGQTLSKEQVLTLSAGASETLKFQFDESELAAR